MTGRISRNQQLDTRATETSLRQLQLRTAQAQRRGDLVELPSYTVSDLPSNITSGKIYLAFCSDESNGAAPVYWDGSDWRRIDDGNVVT